MIYAVITDSYGNKTNTRNRCSLPERTVPHYVCVDMHVCVRVSSTHENISHVT